MKIICEYCKNTIDTDKYSRCPNCMATFKDNKEFKERIASLKEKEKIEIERGQIQNEAAKKILAHTNNVFKSQKYIFSFIIIIFIISLIAGFFIFSRGFKQVKTTEKSIQLTEKSSTVGFDEYGETSKYRVKVDKATDLKKLYEVFTPSEGKKYKVFHLLLENKLNKTLYLGEKVNCIVDDIAQKEVYYFTKYPSLPSHVDKDLKVEGYVIFEVPKDAKKYDLKYGDYITIHIED